jgi:hypothetical protein
MLILKDTVVSVGGTDLSNHVTALDVAISCAEIDITVVGQTGRSRVKGLTEGIVTLQFLQDFNTASVNQVLQTAWSAGTTVPVSVRQPNGPTWTMDGRLLQYTPVSGEVGVAAMTLAEFFGEVTVMDPTRINIIGTRALATTTALPGVLINTRVFVVGVRATATATARPGSSSGMTTGAYGAGPYGAGTYGGLGLWSPTIIGVSAIASCTAQPGAFPVNKTVVGVRASSTATAQTGSVGMLTTWTGPITLIGARATATATAQPGSPMVSLLGARAAATASGQAGADGMLTAWDGPVV